MDIGIPKKAPGKSGLETLKELPKIEASLDQLPKPLERGLYTTESRGVKIDYIYKPGSEQRLFVLLSGYAERTKLVPPVFQRWSWADYFPGHCLYIADPMLSMADDFGLAWYVGTDGNDLRPTIAGIVRAVAKTIDIEEKNIIFYSSSGGGYAALQLVPEFKTAVFAVINPQTDITKYKSRHVGTFLKYCFGGRTRTDAIIQFPQRMSLLPGAEQLARTKILYVQNTADLHHMNDHYIPLEAEISKYIDTSPSSGHKFETMFFEASGGHGPGEPPELFPAIVQRAIEKSQLD